MYLCSFKYLIGLLVYYVGGFSSSSPPCHKKVEQFIAIHCARPFLKVTRLLHILPIQFSGLNAEYLVR